MPAQLYTTLIRGVPDLVLMLLIFYSLQTWLTALTDSWNGNTSKSTLQRRGDHPGLHLRCVFHRNLPRRDSRRARGQVEAATAYGLKRGQRFRFVVFPQMMRFALPGIGNNWMVMLKATALVSIIGLADLVKAAQDAGKSTYQLFYFLVLAA
jgi:histidine transport system permease protein